MKVRAAQKELEIFFADKYPEKYSELGGYYYIKGYKDLGKSLMQKYFSSGQYKELNDSELERYWKQVRKSELRWNVFVVLVIALFYIATGE